MSFFLSVLFRTCYTVIKLCSIVGTHGWLRFVPLSIMMERGTKRNQPWVEIKINALFIWQINIPYE